MKTTTYLYNIDPKSLATMPYKKALETKIQGALKVKAECALNSKNLLNTPAAYQKVMERYDAADKAVEFNRTLLEELE